MAIQDKLDYLKQLKLIQLQNEHLKLDKYFNSYRIPDGYLKGEGNNKCNIGDAENPIYFDNGINPDTGMCVALPQNVAGTFERSPGLSDPPVPIRWNSNDGANSYDVSANGTEADIYSRTNSPSSHQNWNRGNVRINQPQLTYIKGKDGSTNWSGTRTEFLSGQEFNYETVNGKTRLLGGVIANPGDLFLHLSPGMCATKGYGNNSTVNGQGATYDICVSAQKDEVDPAIDYISAGDASGSEANTVDLKQNENDEYARLTLDGNNGKITLTIVGGEEQHNSTIIMTAEDITCITHVFNVIAEESINMFAGE